MYLNTLKQEHVLQLDPQTWNNENKSVTKNLSSDILTPASRSTQSLVIGITAARMAGWWLREKKVNICLWFQLSHRKKRQ